MADIVGFRPTDAARIARAVRRFEQNPLARPQGPGSGALGAASNIQRLKITGTYPGDLETVAGIDYYAADVLRWSVTDGAWTSVAEASPVKVFHPGGGELATDDEVEARMIGMGTFSGTLLVVFEVITAGSATTCTLPASAEQLMEDSPQGGDAWDDTPITLDAPCCHTDTIEERCREDGTGTEWRRVKVYIGTDPDTGRIMFSVAYGPWEGSYPPSDWDPCEPAPEMQFNDATNSQFVPLLF